LSSAHVEHALAHQKNRFNLFIRTVGLALAEAKLTLRNPAYNFNRLILHERRECRAETVYKLAKPVKSTPSTVEIGPIDAVRVSRSLEVIKLGQDRPQHARPPLPQELKRRHIAFPKKKTSNLPETQAKGLPRRRESERYKLEITN